MERWVSTQLAARAFSLLGFSLTILSHLALGQDRLAPVVPLAGAAAPTTRPAFDTSVALELARARAIQAYNDGRHQDASRLLADPTLANDSIALYYRGLLAMQASDPALAANRIAQAVQAEEAPDDALLLLGVNQLLSDAAPESLENLRHYEQRRPDDDFAAFFSGMAFTANGLTSEGDTRLQRAVDNPFVGPVAESRLNQLQQNRGLSTPYGSQPTTMTGQGMGEAYCDACLDTCDGLGDAAARDPWSLTMLLGYQYDSNVTNAPVIRGLGSGQDIADSAATLTLFSDYLLLDGPTYNLGLISSFFGSFHADANDFDVQDYMGGFYSNRLLSENTMAGIRYEFHETTLDYSHFASQHRVTPNLTWLMGDFGHLTSYYEFEHIDFDATPLINALDQDNVTHGIGLTQAIYTQGLDGRFYVGYRYETSDADGSDFDRDTHMVTARYENPLNRCTIFDIEARYFWDDFDFGNSLDYLGRPRADERFEFRTGLQWARTERSSLRFDYTYVDSDSNVSNLFGVHFYQYDRHTVSVQYVYDF